MTSATTLPLPDARDLDGLPVAGPLTRAELAAIYSDVDEIHAAARLTDGRIALDLGGSFCVDRPETADAFGMDLLTLWKSREPVSSSQVSPSLVPSSTPAKGTLASAKGGAR